MTASSETMQGLSTHSRNLIRGVFFITYDFPII